MNRRITSILTAAVIGLTPAIAQTEEIDVYINQLADDSTPDDSIATMYQIFDLSPRTDGTKVAWEILDVADRSGNDSVSLDMLRQIANVNVRNDSIITKLQEMCANYPVSGDQRATTTFLALRKAGIIARYTDEKLRLDKIKELIEEYSDMPADSDIYKQLERLGSLCIILGNSYYSALLPQYIEKSLELAQKLPESDFGLRNLIYNQAMTIYTNLNMPEKAIEADHKLLESMNALEQHYHDKGREHRNFDPYRYTTYRNMLQNYRALSPEEIEVCHDSVLALAARSEEVKASMTNNVTNAYYLMATKQYAAAIPLLKQIIEKPTTDNFNLIRAIRHIIEASEKTGDKATQLAYTTLLNQKLTEYLELAAHDTYSEFKIIYDLYELEHENAELELKTINDKVKFQRTLLISGCVVFVLLIAALAALIIHIRKSRRLSAGLVEANEELRLERVNLLKTQHKLIEARNEARSAEKYKSEFIDNMSDQIGNPLNAIVEYSNLLVDCASDDKRKYLQRYADIVKLNTELLSTIVNDLLDARSLGKDSMTVNAAPSVASDMCLLAMESVRSRLSPGVTMTFEQEGAPDVYVTTDAHRVEQVLINLLTNAAKFTTEGSISVSYTIDRPNNSITFAVTDTGIGIPEGKEEEIFNRFHKLDRSSQGNGLGLTICRMIANLLGGTVKVDTGRKGKGARFLFTIPMS